MGFDLHQSRRSQCISDIKAAAGKGFETTTEANERVRLKKESNAIHLDV